MERGGPLLLRGLLVLALLVLGVLLGIPLFVVGVGGLGAVPLPGPRPAGDLDVRVWLDDAGRLAVMPLEEYVKGVVAAEMPALFHPEALKAQAVVARTYTIRRMRVFGGAGCPGHDQADVCTDPRTGQAFADAETLKRRWGPWRYLVYSRRIAEAVEATRGLILAYQGVPIDAVYHSTSGGRTEDAVAVWGRPVPYLVSVPSPYEERSPRLEQTARFTLPELAARLGLDVAAVRDAARGETLIEVLETSPTGRWQRVRVAGTEFEARELRERLGLNSTLIRWELAGEEVVFHVRGYGHGVGLSQYGADGMARRGADYRAILAHYYPGTELRPIFID